VGAPKGPFATSETIKFLFTSLPPEFIWFISPERSCRCPTLELYNTLEVFSGKLYFVVIPFLDISGKQSG
jgi:hypothetical protein